MLLSEFKQTIKTAFLPLTWADSKVIIHGSLGLALKDKADNADITTILSEIHDIDLVVICKGNSFIPTKIRQGKIIKKNLETLLTKKVDFCVINENMYNRGLNNNFLIHNNISEKSVEICEVTNE